MDIFEDIYKSWREVFIKVAFFLTGFAFGLEVLLSVTMYRFYPDIFKLDKITYVLLYILLPSALNLGLTLFGRWGLESDRFSNEIKNLMAVLILSGICLVISCAHNLYAVAPCSLCFPIYMSVLFSDQKLTKHVTIISFVFVAISTFFAKIDGRAHDSHLIFDTIILAALLICSYFASKYLIRIEVEKARLLKRSYYIQNKLQETVKYDPLTKLFNMRTFYDVLDSTVEKEEFPLSLVVIDIDDFKKINDTYGHEQGNQVLIYLAQLLQAYCASHGYVFRYGGEEFSALFPHMTNIEVKKIMEDMQRRFAKHRFIFDPEVRITFSCGISTCTKRDISSKELFEQADKAMYEAKAAGKNCTLLFLEG